MYVTLGEAFVTPNHTFFTANVISVWLRSSATRGQRALLLARRQKLTLRVWELLPRIQARCGRMHMMYLHT